MSEYNFKHERDELEQLQTLDLKIKILMTKQRIRDWVNEYGEENCYVLRDESSGNGAVQSMVLSEIVHKYYPKIKESDSELDGFKAITPWMACLDEAGINDWLKYGCNHYDTEKPESRPMAFWMVEDLERYCEEY